MPNALKRHPPEYYAAAAAKRRVSARACEQCRGAYTGLPWQRFCSTRCRVTWHRARRAERPEEQTS